MKKILVFIIMLTFFCSCEEKTPQRKERERYEKVSNFYQSHSDLFELTFKDEYGEKRTHQFVLVRTGESMNGIAHWPECKYCKERGLLCTH